MKPRIEHDYHRRITRVIQATLADPAAPHTAQSLTAVARLSPFHFHRIYRALIGEGVFETVRHMRLAQVAQRLSDTEDSVVDVVLNMGYDSLQAFARTSREFAGMNPRAFQTRQQTLNVRSADTGDLPPIELIQRPPLHALYLRHDDSVATIR